MVLHILYILFIVLNILYLNFKLKKLGYLVKITIYHLIEAITIDRLDIVCLILYGKLCFALALMF